MGIRRDWADGGIGLDKEKEGEEKGKVKVHCGDGWDDEEWVRVMGRMVRETGSVMC